MHQFDRLFMLYVAVSERLHVSPTRWDVKLAVKQFY